MYDALVLVDPSSPITFQDVEKVLRARSFSVPPAIQATADHLIVTLNGYHLKLWWAAGPHVRQESAELANEHAKGHPARDRIALCSTRIEVSGDEDMDMDYFNDYVFILEELEKIGTVYIFDVADESFMKP